MLEFICETPLGFVDSMGGVFLQTFHPTGVMTIFIIEDSQPRRGEIIVEKCRHGKQKPRRGEIIIYWQSNTHYKTLAGIGFPTNSILFF